MKRIQLTQGHAAIVDDEDYELLSRFKWHFHRVKGREYGYARTSGKNKILMHRLLLDAVQVDHANGNRLDNRRENLRSATQSQNGTNRGCRADNTSGYKGVSFNKATQKWHAYIKHSQKRYHLGFYATPEEAAQAYNIAASRLFGEFAAFNKVCS